jgi:hypothetical protein
VIFAVPLLCAPRIVWQVTAVGVCTEKTMVLTLTLTLMPKP